MTSFLEGTLIILIFLFFVPSFFLFLVNNIFFQVSLLLFSTLYFTFILILETLSIYFVFQYYLLQEYLGFILFFTVSPFFIFLILIMKMGLSPFFYWTLKFSEPLSKNSFTWFITAQKLYPLILSLLFCHFFLFLSFSSYFVYVNFWVSNSFKFLVLLSSCESMTWLMLVGFFLYSALMGVFYLLFFYLIFYNMSNIESILSFMGLPLTFPFIFKVSSMTFFGGHGSLFLITLISMIFLSMMGFTLIFVFYSLQKTPNIFSVFMIMILSMFFLFLF